MPGGIYWLASYPKSGNTWFRLFMQNLQSVGTQPVQINALAAEPIAAGHRWMSEILGFNSADLSHDEMDQLRPQVYEWSLRNAMPSYHKVHDAWSYLKNGEPLLSARATRGVLYVVRNPLDVAVSLANYGFYTIDQAIADMANPHLALCSKRGRRELQLRQWLFTWSQHVASYLDAPDISLQVLRYEDMKHDPLPHFMRAARFLQLPCDEDKIRKAVAFCEITLLQRQEKQAPFKENVSSAGNFFRKGVVGDWQEQLSELQIQRITDAHGPMMQRLGYLDASGKITDLIKGAQS
jgi:hypothetical protein